MGLSLLQMRQIMRRALGVDANDEGFDDSGCNQKLNMSWWDIMDRYDFREEEITIPFTIGTSIRKLAIPGEVNAVRGISIFDTANQESKLDQMLLTQYDSLYNSSTGSSGTIGLPTNYIRENNYFYLYPTPDQAYSGVLHYWKTLSDLAADADILPIPQAWHQIVLLGGIANGYIELGDLTRYSETTTTRDKMITEAVPTQAKEEKDNRLAHVEVPGRDYP